jgi:ATP-dependent Lon protease
MKTLYPDEFQQLHRHAKYIDSNDLQQYQTHPIDPISTGDKNLTEENTDLDLPIRMISSPLDINENVLTPKILHIQEEETGYSYENLFGQYLSGSRSIKIIDPYVRLEYQIRNLIAFIGIIDTSVGSVELSLTTSAEDAYQEREVSRKLDEIKISVIKHGVNFTYDFSTTVHRRGIEADNGWKIIVDRGLDIFQKPNSKYELSEVDQTKKKCRETEIIYMQGE